MPRPRTTARAAAGNGSAPGRPPLNAHHLELFFYVARHRGISRAIRHIPYGIQQPAISSQLRQLEQELGTKLFDRQPFGLTEAGRKLFAHLEPFFGRLGEMKARLARHAQPQFRLGASELVSRDHLPAVVQSVRVAHPTHRFFIRAGGQAQLEQGLQDHQLDLIFVTALQDNRVPGVTRLPLLRMPLVLLVHRDSPWRSAEELWHRSPVEEPLISLPISGTSFQRGLRRRQVEWQPSIEASSLELVTWYVAHNYGIGVQVDVPDVVRHPAVRALPLPGFDPVEIVAMWRGRPDVLVRDTLRIAQAYIERTWPQLACHAAVQ